MQLELNHTMEIATVSEKVIKSMQDYSETLKQFGVDFKQIDYHLQVGEITKVQGWILHISVVRSQVEELLGILIPELISKKVPFKMLQDYETVRNLLDGTLGDEQVGKVISIYPHNEVDALYLAKKLIVLTAIFKGPAILTDIHLGGNVYTRYGSFNPVVMSNAAGKQEKYIYNSEGQLVADIYNIPFVLPKGIEWPFSALASPIAPPKKKILNQIYKPIAVLKSDVKGNVIKAIYLKKIFRINWCVIKQGKKNMWSDEAGRDMIDRLLWQQEIHNKLAGKIPLPKILDLFVENEDTYLVMEYIKGLSLYDSIANNNNNCDAWDQLPFEKQMIALNYLLQIVNIIDQLHKNGCVHRDVTPVNFLVNKKNQLVLIDNELVYSLHSKKPAPAFAFGTPGFVSPEQKTQEPPTIKEDIYGLGATMLKVLTGLSPLTFNTDDSEALRENLYFFVQSRPIVETIVHCLAADPEIRPAPSFIKNILEQYKNQLQQEKIRTKQSPVRREKIDSFQLENIISGAIEGLTEAPILIVNYLWQSRISNGPENIGTEKTLFGKSGGLYEGITGVLYFLSKAQKMGFDISSCEKSYDKGWQFIEENYLQTLPNISPGFYGGAAGIALAIASAMDADLLTVNDKNSILIKKCFELPPVGLDVANGIAGQGISAMQCAEYMEKNTLHNLLKGYIRPLIEMQHKKGFWLQLRNEAGKRRNIASFSFGNTGITWFLLQYYSLKNEDVEVKRAISKSLEFLTKLSGSLKKSLKESGSRGIITSGGVLGDSLQGIILTFIKAYEVLGIDTFKRLAEEILSLYPAHIVHDNFTQDTGLASMGELYLEAANVFNNVEWQRRADWIANVLANTCRREINLTNHWTGNNCEFVTADFMVGNSGIIYFLMRYLKNAKVGYRLLQ